MAAPVDNAIFDALMTIFFAACALVGARAALRPYQTRQALAQLHERYPMIVVLSPPREHAASMRYFVACGVLTAAAAAIGAASCGSRLLQLIRA